MLEIFKNKGVLLGIFAGLAALSVLFGKPALAAVFSDPSLADKFTLVFTTVAAIWAGFSKGPSQ
jgi:hypothetical protein